MRIQMISVTQIARLCLMFAGYLLLVAGPVQSQAGAPAAGQYIDCAAVRGGERVDIGDALVTVTPAQPDRVHLSVELRDEVRERLIACFDAIDANPTPETDRATHDQVHHAGEESIEGVAAHDIDKAAHTNSTLAVYGVLWALMFIIGLFLGGIVADWWCYGRY